MKLTWMNLIAIIAITVLLTYGLLYSFERVTLTFLNRAEYNELKAITQQSQDRIAQLELGLQEVNRAHNVMDRILKEKKVLP